MDLFANQDPLHYYSKYVCAQYASKAVDHSQIDMFLSDVPKIYQFNSKFIAVLRQM